MARQPLGFEQEGEAPRLTLRIAPTDLDRLNKAARRLGLKPSRVVRDALIDALDRLDRREAVTA